MPKIKADSFLCAMAAYIWTGYFSDDLKRHSSGGVRRRCAWLAHAYILSSPAPEKDSDRCHFICHIVDFELLDANPV